MAEADGAEGDRQRVRDALAHASALLADTSIAGAPEPGDDDVLLDRWIDALFEELRAELRGRKPTRAAELGLTALELQQLRAELLASRTARRVEVLRGVQEALSRLHGVGSPAQLYDIATAAVCECCGFDRAILFGVEGPELVAQSVHFAQDPEWAAQVLEFARTEGRPRLDELILETEMLRRRAPAIITDPQHDPRAATAMIEATATRSYVAAPILPDGKVIGFLHADHFHSGRPVDEVDRDALWAFAEGYGFAVERTLLRTHLDQQRRQLQDITGALAGLSAEICNAELTLDRQQRAALDASSRAVSIALPAGGEALMLTPREREVLALMADGETNASIARRLYISESTAKAHVKNVMKKTGASNRAEAVARFMRAQPQPGSPIG